MASACVCARGGLSGDRIESTHCSTRDVAPPAVECVDTVWIAAQVARNTVQDTMNFLNCSEEVAVAWRAGKRQMMIDTTAALKNGLLIGKDAAEVKFHFFIPPLPFYFHTNLYRCVFLWPVVEEGGLLTRDVRRSWATT